MKLYVMRHGESEANYGKFHSGWTQVSLTERGREQARLTGKQMEQVHVDRIFCSDLLRAIQTAELIFPGQEYVLDARLRELGTGDASGRTWDECYDRWGEEFRVTSKLRDFTPYGGENSDMQVARVAEFMESLSELSDDEQIAVVCHAGTIYSILRYVLGVDFGRDNVEVANASVSCFTRKDGQWRLSKWNVTGTLSEGGCTKKEVD